MKIVNDRRSFLKTTGCLAASAAVSSHRPLVASSDAATGAPLGKAEHVIFIWLGGGASQIDTWDPKRVTNDGQKDPGSAYPAIDTAIPGVQVCEHLKHTAKLFDRCVPVRSVNHDVIDEHAAAAYRMHTGRVTSGTIVYPSLGSAISAVKGSANDLVPSYVLIGNPSPARAPGFLGAEHGYVYLTETSSGPKGLTRPARVDEDRHRRRMDLLKRMRDRYVSKHSGEASIADYVSTTERGFRLAGPEFMKVFSLDREPNDLRESYGDEFGQRCLLARRLVERGTRFVEVSFNLNFKNGTGWDTHNEGHLKQHLLIQSLDQAFATLLTDLESKQLLDKTLVVISTEFGRPADFDAGGGRGHHGKAFSVVLAGGGLRTGQAVGMTDELGMNIVENPVSVPDLFATIFAGVGMNPAEVLYAGDRPVPLTDGGQPIACLFS
ncbi:MAG: DUF1501 domain-containing protein [Planctomycetaceae bacterium]|nr:DUF1501 domain-containing protein [Planctomycetaceae bacterium]